MNRLNPPAELPLDLKLPPLQIEVYDKSEVCDIIESRDRTRNLRPDGTVQIKWGGKSYRFVVEYKPLSTPKHFDEALRQLRRYTEATKLSPLLVTPYLSDDQLKMLEQKGVSGIDLSGNGVVVVPPALLVYRSGAPNRFSSSTLLKNIYRRNTSLVARVFLLQPKYSSVNHIQDEIQRRGGTLSLSTVSKALSVLEQDLIVGRTGGQIALLQPEKLLDRLVTNFERPNSVRTFTGKAGIARQALMQVLAETGQTAGAASEASRIKAVRVAVTGSNSVGQYAVMAKEEMLRFYCSNLDAILLKIPATKDAFFPDLEIVETRDETAYFDLRVQNGLPWASPLQTYLELMSGEKRERETADQVRTLLLKSPDMTPPEGTLREA